MKMTEPTKDPRAKRGGIISSAWCFIYLLLADMRSLRSQVLLAAITMTVGAVGLAMTFFVGDGAMRGLWKDLEEITGSEAIIHADPDPEHQLMKLRPYLNFTDVDFDRLRTGIATGGLVAPLVLRRTSVTAGDRSWSWYVEGITEISLSRHRYRVIEGRGFSAVSLLGVTPECLLTASAATALPGVTDPGKTWISINSRRMRVVGIIADPPSTSLPFRQRVVIPYATAASWWEKPGIRSNIMLYWDSAEVRDRVIESAKRILDRCRLPDAYQIDSSYLLPEKRKTLVSNLMVYASVQAIFTLVVASIGMVNVALANVDRRAKEIAIRLVSGARAMEIVALVICENMVTGMLCGLGGAVLGALLANPACRAVAHYVPYASGLEPHWTLRGLVIPVLACSLCGLFTGILPAWRAGRIDILRALREG